MICEHCYGKGIRGSVEWNDARCCPECHGSGIVSCCDTAGATDIEMRLLFRFDLNNTEDKAQARRLLKGQQE